MKKIIFVMLAGVLWIGALGFVKADENQFVRERLEEAYRSGATQKQLAADMRVHPSTMSRYLGGGIQHSPTIVAAYKAKYPFTLPQKLPVQQKKRVRAQSVSPSRVKQLVIEKKQSQTENERRDGGNAPILIAYRKDGDGKGSYYDHMSLQRATQHPTKAVINPQFRSEKLAEFTRSAVFTFPHGEPHEGKKIIPFTEDLEGGLLVIPGRMRDQEFDPVRRDHELHLIQKARLNGQPIVAICAGSWRLWESFGGTLKEVKDHGYGGGMMRFSQSTGRVVNNVQVHGIHVEKDSILAQAMSISSESPLSVNSVHWKAPDEASCPPELLISARSTSEGVTKVPHRRVDGALMEPEEESVEAFENKKGAPTVAIGWHAESYNQNDDVSVLNPDPHRRLLQYMAKAGTAYARRKEMVQELKGLFLAMGQGDEERRDP